jgi:hypothetical protein
MGKKRTLSAEQIVGIKDGQDLGESKKDIAVVMMDQGGVVGLSLIRRRQRRRLPSRQQENEKTKKEALV